MFLLVFSLLGSSHGHQLLKVLVVRHQIRKRVHCLNSTFLNPDNPIASIEYMKLVCGQDTALVLKKAAYSVVHDVSSDMCVNSR
jgi:hypothetical protein